MRWCFAKERVARIQPGSCNTACGGALSQQVTSGCELWSRRKLTSIAILPRISSLAFTFVARLFSARLAPTALTHVIVARVGMATRCHFVACGG